MVVIMDDVEVVRLRSPFVSHSSRFFAVHLKVPQSALPCLILMCIARMVQLQRRMQVVRYSDIAGSAIALDLAYYWLRKGSV
jgi:hypothetical protein